MVGHGIKRTSHGARFLALTLCLMHMTAANSEEEFERGYPPDKAIEHLNRIKSIHDKTLIVNQPQKNTSELIKSGFVDTRKKEGLKNEPAQRTTIAEATPYTEPRQIELDGLNSISNNKSTKSLQGQVLSRLQTMESLHQSSAISTFSGRVDLVLGGTAYSTVASRRSIGSGSGSKLYTYPQNALSTNYRLTLDIKTTFSGIDYLLVRLRGGDFGSSAFSGYRAYVPTAGLDVAYEGDTKGNLQVTRLFYRLPLAGDQLEIVFGPAIQTTDMLATQPTIYSGGDYILEVFRQAGIPMAYAYEFNQTSWDTGTGLGAWIRSKRNLRGERISFSANYLSPIASHGYAAHGGLGATHSRGKFMSQLAYGSSMWQLSGVYSYSQAESLIGLGTPKGGGWLLPKSLAHTIGFNAFWQPKGPGLIPSISVGWGLSRISTQHLLDGSTEAVMSWMVGLEWSNAFVDDGALGIGITQPPWAVKLKEKAMRSDINTATELWYRYPISDKISLTPAIFYLNQPFGITTGKRGYGQTGNPRFNVLGALLKVSIIF